PNDPFVAHSGHWVGRVPPGTYVVQARAANGSAITDHAIAEACCEDTVCVRLFVPHGRQEEPPRQRCEIVIKEVSGVGEPVPSAIQVAGTAAGCTELEVTVSCATQGTKKMVVAISPSGAWKAT